MLHGVICLPSDFLFCFVFCLEYLLHITPAFFADVLTNSMDGFAQTSTIQPASGNGLLHSKLTCLPSTALDGLDHNTTFTFDDMTLTVCVELCRGQSAPWAVVEFNHCHCYGDGVGTWATLRAAEHRVSCGLVCPGHQFQHCGGDGEVVVMIVGE